MTKEQQLKIDKAIFKLLDPYGRHKMILQRTKTFKEYTDEYTKLNNNFK